MPPPALPALFPFQSTSADVIPDAKPVQDHRPVISTMKSRYPTPSTPRPHQLRATPERKGEGEIEFLAASYQEITRLKRDLNEQVCFLYLLFVTNSRCGIAALFHLL